MVNKKIVLSVIIIVAALLIPSINAQTKTIDHSINILTKEDFISVQENLEIENNKTGFYEEIIFWIPAGAKEITVYLNDNKLTSPSISNNYYNYNISNLNINKNTTLNVKIGYNIPLETNSFKKIINHKTDRFSINFEEKQLFKGEDLEPGTTIIISLYTPSETPLSSFIIWSIVLLIIVAVVVIFILTKRKKTSITKRSMSDSEEILTTRKTLLMNLLKEVEKKHRANQISDDTYHKIKNNYKQEAVETMKKLEDLKSKVK